MGKTDYEWALAHGYLNYCKEHDLYFDRNMRCPKCPRSPLPMLRKPKVSPDFIAQVNKLLK